MSASAAGSPAACQATSDCVLLRARRIVQGSCSAAPTLACVASHFLDGGHAAEHLAAAAQQRLGSRDLLEGNGLHGKQRSKGEVSHCKVHSKTARRAPAGSLPAQARRDPTRCRTRRRQAGFLPVGQGNAHHLPLER